MYSKNIFEVAERANLWSKKKDGQILDFTKTFSPPRMHSLYATRRVWRVFTLLDPSLDLDPDTDNYATDYPFSVKPVKKLSQKSMMDLQRDHYEGTKFDLTKGIAAGPYGDPERFDPAPSAEMPDMKDVLQGAYERSISMFRTSYSIVCVARGHLPDSVGALLWFAQYAPHTSTYSPFYVQSLEAPKPFTKGSFFKYDSSVAFWNFLSCGNWANRFYRFAEPVVKEVQNNLEEEFITQSKMLEDTAVDLLSICEKEKTCDKNNVHVKVTEMLTEFTVTRGQQTTDTYRELFPKLMTQFHDGVQFSNLDKPDYKLTKMFYPKWWLSDTGFFNNKPNDIPGEIMYETNPSLAGGHYASASEYYAGILSTGLFVGMVALGVGFVVGKREIIGSNRFVYDAIDSRL
jgi:dipeptidase